MKRRFAGCHPAAIVVTLAVALSAMSGLGLPGMRASAQTSSPSASPTPSVSCTASVSQFSFEVNPTRIVSGATVTAGGVDRDHGNCATPSRANMTLLAKTGSDVDFVAVESTIVRDDGTYSFNDQHPLVTTTYKVARNGGVLDNTARTVTVTTTECTTPLQLRLVKLRTQPSRPAPPEGYDYATQPPADARAGHGVLVSARVTHGDSCPVAAAEVRLKARNLGSFGFATVRTGRTSISGYVSFQVWPHRNTDLLADTRVDDETATSSLVRVNIRPRVSASFQEMSGCRIVAEGGTYPTKPGHPVWLQRRITRDGVETGYVTITRATISSDGRYRLAYVAPCGAVYALATYVPASATNVAGRSVYVDLRVQARV